MSRVIFAHPNFADVRSTLYAPTFSGGSWKGALPLANLQDPRMIFIARSTDATAANTKFDLDLKTARVFQAIAFPGRHNLSIAATIRIRASNVAGDFSAPTYDSGTINVWPAALSAEDGIGIRIGFTIVIPTAPTASRYLRFEFDDHTNAAGYIDLPRIVVAPIYQPTKNWAWNATIGFASGSSRVVSDGNAFLFNRQPNRRVAALVLEDEPLDETLVQALELQRKLGVSGQLLFIWDDADVAQMYRRSFLATLKTLSPLQFQTVGALSAPFSLEEVL